METISSQVGVATSTIRRLAHASDAEADGVALIGWLGVEPEHFVIDSRVAGMPLPPAGDGMIRVNMEQLANLPGSPRRERVGSRRTIQHLARAAQASRRPIASLTRWSAT